MYFKIYFFTKCIFLNIFQHSYTFCLYFNTKFAELGNLKNNNVPVYILASQVWTQFLKFLKSVVGQASSNSSITSE